LKVLLLLLSCCSIQYLRSWLKELVTVMLFTLRSWLRRLVTVMLFFTVPEELVEGFIYCDTVLYST
jgi:hypothetical protein